MATTEERPPAETPIQTIEERIEALRKRSAALLDPARKDAVRKQHEKGKLTARERIELLLDRTRSRKPTRSPSTARTTSGWIAIGPLGTAS